MSRRKLTDQDIDDWSRVAETVRPLPDRKRNAKKPVAKPQGASKGAGAKAGAKTGKTAASAGPGRRGEANAAEKPARPATATADPYSPRPAGTRSGTRTPGLDQFATRYVKRGKGPDARVDLHGMTQAQAHERLSRFLHGEHARGSRLVLVITGKGRSSAGGEWWEGDQRGVLRRAVPAWLAAPEFRALVAGFQPAAREHGGEGAFYVQLRSRKGADRGAAKGRGRGRAP